MSGYPEHRDPAQPAQHGAARAENARQARAPQALLTLGRLPVYRARSVRAWLAEREAEIEVFYLPPYSPELNPDEGSAVLERPEIPLHTNGSENDIRACVTKRKLSGGTMSEAGRGARDVLLGLMKTCRKLGVSFFRYLGDRLRVPGAAPIPPLPGLVRKAAAAT